MIYSLHNPVTARCKELARAGSTDPLTGQTITYQSFRFVCGRTLPCPEIIGYASNHPDKQPDPLQVRLASAVGPEPIDVEKIEEALERSEGADEGFDILEVGLRLTHDRGYWWDEEHEIYRVCSGRPSRRNVPSYLLGKTVSDPYLHFVPNPGENRRQVIGRFPLIPTEVECPKCHHANHVDMPELHKF